MKPPLANDGRSASPEATLIVHGLDLSYFTGKLEGYLRCKGLAYRLQEMDSAAFRALAERTGVRQMPHLELPDGRWLTDTPVILDVLEQESPEPTLTPADPAVAFLAAMIEVYGDEHLWRPALYYRWAFPADAGLMSDRIAEGMLRDVPAPRALRRRIALMRQRTTYLAGEGVTRANRSEIEADYHLLLDALEPVLQRRSWVLGDAPTRADIGLFGPLFRHFACDPTPARIMRAKAPAVAAWTARLWAQTPYTVRSAIAIADLPADLAPLLALIEHRFLPELAANGEAFGARRPSMRYVQGAASFRYRTNPYRAWRLDRLRRGYAALSGADRARLPFGQSTLALLSVEPHRGLPPSPPGVGHEGGVRDRWWRGGAISPR